MNRTLTSLKLSFNNIETQGACELGEAMKAPRRRRQWAVRTLQVNRVLTSLDVHGDRIGAEANLALQVWLPLLARQTAAMLCSGILSLLQSMHCWRRMWRASGRTPAPAHLCRLCGRRFSAIRACSSGM